MKISLAFARKYRPKTFAEVIGQEHVTKALKNALSSKRSHHAYLFAGTRGVGKTTVARLCAKLVNCQNPTKESEPCLVCPSCLQIDHGSSLNYVEMDGASNNGVEHVRQLIETAQYLPVDAPKKVYVIDEVHMLSQSAFNALLKTLEEPPDHVVFIFATTEIEKIPDTILSRCLRFDLRSLSRERIIEQLKIIINNEHIKVDRNSTLETLATYARGSMRDAINLLEQVMALSVNQTLTDELIALSLGRLQHNQVQTLLGLVLKGNHKALSKNFEEILLQNIDLESLALQLLEEVYATLQSNLDKNNSASNLPEFFWLFEQMSKDFQWGLKSLTPSHTIHALLLKYCLRHTLAQTTPSAPEISQEEVLEVKKKVDLSAEKLWDLVHHDLKAISPAAASTWAHTWGEFFQQTPAGVTLKLFYRQEDNFLLENFLTGRWWQESKDYLAKHLGIEPQKLQIDVEIVQDSLPVENETKSVLERNDEQLKNKSEERKKNIVENQGIRHIESIFNAKVDKVLLK